MLSIKINKTHLLVNIHPQKVRRVNQHSKFNLKHSNNIKEVNTKNKNAIFVKNKVKFMHFSVSRFAYSKFTGFKLKNKYKFSDFLKTCDYFLSITFNY